jgi:hypothetical protein
MCSALEAIWRPVATTSPSVAASKRSKILRVGRLPAELSIAFAAEKTCRKVFVHFLNVVHRFG